MAKTRQPHADEWETQTHLYTEKMRTRRPEARRICKPSVFTSAAISAKGTGPSSIGT